MITIYLYKITNEVNGKNYIGKTKLSLEKRFKQHIKESKKERCKHRPLYRAMNKYGVENFTVELLEENDIPEEREIYYIKKFNTYGNTGYNATKGGDGKSYLNLDEREVISLYYKIKSSVKVATLVNADPGTIRNILAQHNINVFPPNTMGYRAVYCSTMKRAFPSLQSAANFVISYKDENLNKDTVVKKIHRVINKQRKTCYGFSWCKL